MNRHLPVLPILVIAISIMLAACGSNNTVPRTPATPTTLPESVTPNAALPDVTLADTVPRTPATPTMLPESVTPNAALPDVTLADAGTVVAMHVGQSFLLNLGSDGWNVTVADQAIVSRVINITVVRGAQGVYRAHALGQTTLDAIGPSPCPNAVPACGAPQRTFRVTIVVT